MNEWTCIQLGHHKRINEIIKEEHSLKDLIDELVLKYVTRQQENLIKECVKKYLDTVTFMVRNKNV